MGNLLTKVQIDGVTIWDDSDSGSASLLIGWSYERTGTSQISEIKLDVLASINSTVSLSVGKTLTVWKGFTTSTDVKVFDGYIAEFEPNGGLIVITGKDKLWDLVRKNVNKVYESSGPQAGQISAIATDLIETYGGLTGDVVATGTGTTEIISEFRCVHTDIFERLKALADAVRYQFWYDAENDTVHFEPEGYNDSGETLTVGTEIIGMPKWTYDTSRMVNDLRVDGAVALTQIRKPLGSGDATIGTTADFTTTYILLDKTPENVELIVDGDVKTGGTKDASTGHYYYVDKENKKIMPKTGTTFPTDTCHVNYTWYAPSPIHQINQFSIDTYGKFEKQMTFSDIITIADAEVRTTDILAKFSQPFLVGELMVQSSESIDVNLGDTVTVVDTLNYPNINQKLVVTKQVMRYPGSYQTLVVGDESLKLADWQVDVEARLKRIEESLSLQNQDLILELVDIQHTAQQVVPRYVIIEDKNIAGDSMVWGSTTFGTWGTDKWKNPAVTVLHYDSAEVGLYSINYYGGSGSGNFVLGNTSFGILGTSGLGAISANEVTHWIGQYEDIYTETFYDTDFKSTNTTATWSDDGFVAFTSGQIAESSSIDYNNGTITTATITATLTTGSVDLELTADGGDNWESVTSGTAHTFTATGNDLRWRATESGSTTAELTKIIVEDYH